MIDGSAKGPCGPKTGQKVVFLEGEKGLSKKSLFPQNRAQKGKRAIRPHPESVNFLYTSESVIGIFPKNTYKGSMLWRSFRYNTFRDMDLLSSDRRTESDAYEPTVQYAQVGSKIGPTASLALIMRLHANLGINRMYSYGARAASVKHKCQGKKMQLDVGVSPPANTMTFRPGLTYLTFDLDPSSDQIS